MSLYQHSQTGEVREIDAELIAAWVAAGNPKASVWQAYTPPPAPPPAPPPPKTAEEKLAAAREALAAVEALAEPVFTTDVLDVLADMRQALED
jgi:hypothetical protein